MPDPPLGKTPPHSRARPLRDAAKRPKAAFPRAACDLRRRGFRHAVFSGHTQGGLFLFPCLPQGRGESVRQWQAEAPPASRQIRTPPAPGLSCLLGALPLLRPSLPSARPFGRKSLPGVSGPGFLPQGKVFRPRTLCRAFLSPPHGEKTRYVSRPFSRRRREAPAKTRPHGAAPPPPRKPKKSPARENRVFPYRAERPFSCPSRRPCPKATLFLPAGRAVPWEHR